MPQGDTLDLEANELLALLLCATGSSAQSRRNVDPWAHIHDLIFSCLLSSFISQGARTLEEIRDAALEAYGELMALDVFDAVDVVLGEGKVGGCWGQRHCWWHRARVRSDGVRRRLDVF